MNLNLLKKVGKLKRIWLILLAPIMLICLEISKVNSNFAENVFAKGIFKVYSQIVSNITGVLPFSLAEFAIVIGFVFIPVFIALWIRHIVKHKDTRWYVLVKGIINLVCIASLVISMLILGCSINYYRYPVSYYCGLEVRDSSKEELYELCVALAEAANEARAQITSEDENGVYLLTMNVRELGKECKQAMNVLSEELPILKGIYPRPKSVFFSDFMSNLRLTGIYVPFTMEANVNTSASDYSIAATMCHELAHLHGFIKEDEANYISYIVCMASDDIEVRYSGLMEGLIHTGNALYGKDADLYYQARALYSDAVNRDLAANSAYWQQFEKKVISQVAEQANDTYLKANGQEDGVQSYGRMVDLLLADFRKNKEID